MTVRFVSLFSGVESASLAWEKLGWECVAFSEIESFPCEVLRQRWPHVPNLGDVTKIAEAQIAALGRIDVVVFGSPCQDLSLAGKRKGFDGERSGLFFDAMRIVRWLRRWCGLRFALWENVFGAFSSNKGRDFAAVVAEMAGLDHVEPPVVGKKTKWGNEGCAVGDDALLEWACLDAQWFGVAQRRRRVFALADFGDWANRPPILLEPESMRGDSAPKRGSRKEAAVNARNSIAFGGNNTSGPIEVATARNASASATGRLDFESETFIVVDTTQITSPLNYSSPKPGDPCHPLMANGHAPMIIFNSNAQPDQMRFDAHVTSALTCSQYAAFASVAGTLTQRMGEGFNGQDAHAGLLVQRAMQVRRLTPLECERLQGFPDNHTNIIVRGKPAADGPRYKAIGNSKAVPVVTWIGQRIDFVLRYF